jgi:hypothetical protein
VIDGNPILIVNPLLQLKNQCPVYSNEALEVMYIKGFFEKK